MVVHFVFCGSEVMVVHFVFGGSELMVVHFVFGGGKVMVVYFVWYGSVLMLVHFVLCGDRIQTVLRAIKQMQTHARRYRRQIEDRLLASQENTKRVGSATCLSQSVELP